MTPYQSYRKLTWTSEDDTCEHGCGCTLSETSYVEGTLGHYCSTECLEAAEGELATPDDLYLDGPSHHRGDREDFHSDG